MKATIQIFGIMALLAILLMGIGGLLTWLGMEEYHVGLFSGIAISYTSIYLHKTVSK